VGGSRLGGLGCAVGLLTESVYEYAGRLYLLSVGFFVMSCTGTLSHCIVAYKLPRNMYLSYHARAQVTILQRVATGTERTTGHWHSALYGKD